MHVFSNLYEVASYSTRAKNGLKENLYAKYLYIKI